MGRFKAKSWLVGFGWVGTALMGVAVVALLWSSFGVTPYGSLLPHEWDCEWEYCAPG